MQTEDEQVKSLLKKIEQQDELVDKLTQQELKLTNYIKEFRETLDKKVNNHQQHPTRSVVDQEKLEKQMERELQNARNMHKNYQNQLKNLQKKANKNKYTSDGLLDMEVEIKKKEAHIKELNDDIKNLNIVKRKQQKLIEKKEKNEDGARLSKLVDEIRKQREVLDSLKDKLQQKQRAIYKRKHQIVEMQGQYIEKCKKHGERPLTFQQFKQRRVQKNREESVSKVSHVEVKKQAKKAITIKEIINSHLEMENIDISEKSLNQLTEKKAVAENSLKIARRKYERQIEELQERVEGLMRENGSLNTRYLEKKKEKQLIETARNVNFKRNSSKTMKKLDPIK